MYTELCRIDIINNNLESSYPYTLQDDVVFTQHEIVLQYKKNYCSNIKVLEEPSATGGANDVSMDDDPDEGPSYTYMLY